MSASKTLTAEEFYFGSIASSLLASNPNCDRPEREKIYAQAHERAREMIKYRHGAHHDEEHIDDD
jgi:hypothetical protein